MCTQSPGAAVFAFDGTDYAILSWAYCSRVSEVPGTVRQDRSYLLMAIDHWTHHWERFARRDREVQEYDHTCSPVHRDDPNDGDGAQVEARSVCTGYTCSIDSRGRR